MERWYHHGECVRPLIESIEVMSTGADLESCEFVFETDFSMVTSEENGVHPKVAEDSYFAEKLATLTMNMCHCYIEKKCFNWFGWPNKAQLICSENTDLATEVINEQMDDMECMQATEEHSKDTGFLRQFMKSARAEQFRP